MFDVGFMELGLIGVVALLVIGPERLPKLAKTAGMWAGRARRMISSVKRDIERELQAEELKKAMDANSIKNPVHEIIEDTKAGFQDVKTQTEAAVESAQAPAKSDTGDPGKA